MRSTSAINPVTTKNMDDSRAPTIKPRKGHYTLLSAMFSLLQMKNSRRRNQPSHHRKYERYINVGNPLHYCKSTPWAVSKKRWDTKEDKVSPWCVHCIYCGIPKGMSPDKVMSISEKFSKFCNNLLEALRVVLKALLGLIIPNQYCQSTRMVL